MLKGKNTKNEGQNPEKEGPTGHERGMSRTQPTANPPISGESQKDCILRYGVIVLAQRKPK